MQTVDVVAGQIGDLIELNSTGSPHPLHHVVDTDKLVVLMADMRVRGWHGAPIVVDGDDACTGSHRIAACVKLWNDEGIDIGIPQVEITDVASLYGVDWDAHRQECGDSWYEAVRTISDRLPAAVVEYLGLDAH
jgi:hypothetical protein